MHVSTSGFQLKKALRKSSSGLQDACVLSIGVSFAMVVVGVDLVGDGDLQVAVGALRAAVSGFVCFIRG